MTHAQKILEAALGLDADGFDDHALVLRAWQAHPAAFSLRGTEGKHPNAVAVLSKVPGLIARGLLRRVATSTLQVTATGRRSAEAPASPPAPAPPPTRPAVTLADAAVLDRLLRSSVGGCITRPRVVALAEAEAFWRAGGGRVAVVELLDRACDPRARLASHPALDDRGRLLQLRTLHRSLAARFGQAVTRG